MTPCLLKPHGPGRFAHWIIRRMTGQGMTAGCGCCKRAQQFDRWGWFGCLRRIGKVRDSILVEAGKRGLVFSGRGWGAALDAWRAVRRDDWRPKRNPDTKAS
mgnify:CR=1 FL=1